MNLRGTTLFFRMIAFAILVALVAYRCARADNYVGSAPAEVQRYQRSLGDQTLYIEMCLPGGVICHYRQAIAYGQVCDSALARSIGTGESGEMDGDGWTGERYAGFKCGARGKLHGPRERIFGGGNFMD